MSAGLRIALGGAAVVCCVHDREKRQVLTEAKVAELGAAVGQVYDSRRHKLHLCACCENLFVDPSDNPRFCGACQAPLVHRLDGPLPEPIGEV